MLLRGVSAIALVAAILAVILVGCASSDTRPPLSSTPAVESTIRISGSGSALPAVQKLAEAYGLAHREARLEIEGGTNTGGAIRGVLEGTLDIAVANRPLSNSEIAGGLKTYAIARDAVVFAAHRMAPLSGLSSAQVRDVFGGSVTDWSQLGMAPGPILVLDRDEDESARKVVLLKLMGERPVKARAIVLTSARDMIGALESTEDSLGYTLLGLLRIQRPRGVQVLALDGVVPSAASVEDGSYPWDLTLALISRSDAPRQVRRFIDFVTGPEGNRILEGYGYVVARP